MPTTMSRASCASSHLSLTEHFIYLLCLTALGLCCCVQSLSSCGPWASHCGGFSRCGIQALGLEGFSSCGLVAPGHVEPSQTRD